MTGLNHQFSLKNLASKMQISKDDIKKYLPHRKPFLFIDEVVNIDKNNEIHARKVITSNEYFLEGHFPGNPIFPGVIIIEALGQASGILGFVTMDKTPEEGSIYVLAGVDKVRFRKRVRPGDTIDIYSKVLGEKKGIWKFGAFEVQSERRLRASAA